jgi:hypothetical protein
LVPRLNILPEPAFLELRPVLSERLARIGSSIHAAQFGSLLDPLMRQALQAGFSAAGADEGTVWLLDEAGENLVPGYNTGPNADKLVGRFKQPLNAGLICMVFASEQPFLENEVGKNSEKSQLLDRMLGVTTYAMIAAPFTFLQGCRGVISCVQLHTPASGKSDPVGFRPEHLATIQRTTAVLSQLIEFRLLSQTVGWTNH